MAFDAAPTFLLLQAIKEVAKLRQKK